MLRRVRVVGFTTGVRGLGLSAKAVFARPASFGVGVQAAFESASASRSACPNAWLSSASRGGCEDRAKLRRSLRAFSINAASSTAACMRCLTVALTVASTLATTMDSFVSPTAASISIFGMNSTPMTSSALLRHELLLGAGGLRELRGETWSTRSLGTLEAEPCPSERWLIAHDSEADTEAYVVGRLVFVDAYVSPCACGNRP